MIKPESGHVKLKFQIILIKWHDHFPSNSHMTFKLWKLYLQTNSFKCSLIKDFTWAGEHLQFWIFSLQRGHTLSLTLGLLLSSSDTDHVPMCHFLTSHSAHVGAGFALKEPLPTTERKSALTFCHTKSKREIAEEWNINQQCAVQLPPT